MRQGDHRKHSSDINDNIDGAGAVTHFLRVWGNYSASLSFPLFSYKIKITILLVNTSSQRPVETPLFLDELPFRVELSGFITHCSKGQESSWKTICCLIKKMLERTYRMWAVLGDLMESFRKLSLLWMKAVKKWGSSLTGDLNLKSKKA